MSLVTLECALNGTILYDEATLSLWFDCKSIRLLSGDTLQLVLLLFVSLLTCSRLDHVIVL